MSARQRSGTGTGAMSATLAQLIDRLRVRTQAAPPTRESAEQAIAALGQLARAMTHLSTDSGGETRLASPFQHQLAAALTAHCTTAARAWLPLAGALPDLAGAAADLAARWAPQLSPAQRWAIVVAVAEASADTAATALRHGPYAGNNALAAARNAALALEQHAAADPPSPIAATVLDRTVPSVRLEPSLTPARGATEAAATLTGSVGAAVADHSLTLDDALATAAVARYAAHLAVAVAHKMGDLAGAIAVPAPQGSPATWRSTADSWLAVQLAYAPFDDGTKRAEPRPDNPVRQWALLLFDALRDLPGAPGPDDAAPAGRDDLAQRVTVLRNVVSHLPALAGRLRSATDHWVEGGRLLAPARSLDRFELASQAYVPHESVALVVATDLAGVHTALDDARTLSIGLAACLDSLAPHPGERPNLAFAYRQAVGELRPAGADRRARTAQRRLALDPPPQWGFVRVRRAGAPPRSR